MKQTKRAVILVRDLRAGDNGAGRPFLLCQTCGGQFSADAGDYFAANPETVIKCCGRPVVRVAKRCAYVEA